MTEFLYRVGPKTSAVRQVWLLAWLAVGTTALVLFLMSLASKQVRATSENLSETQEAMHKMAVSLDLRLSDAQHEQAGWLGGQPPEADDSSTKLDESLAERFSLVRGATHLSSVSNNIVALEDSVRELKRFTASCRDWFLSQSNTHAELALVMERSTRLLRGTSAQIGEAERALQKKLKVSFDHFLSLPAGPEATKLSHVILTQQASSANKAEALQELAALALLVEKISNEETLEALDAYQTSLFPDSLNRLFAAFDKLTDPGLIQKLNVARAALREQFLSSANEPPANNKNSSLQALCRKSLELAQQRQQLQRDSAARIDEIRSSNVDLQIGFNTLQHDASVAASASMQRTGRNLLWFGLLFGVSFLVLAVRIASALREQLSTIQRNSAALDKAAVEAQLAADSVRRSEERTRLIVDTALDAVISMDERGLITGWNKQAEHTFGWRPEEVRGKVLAEVIIPEALRGVGDEGFQRLVRTDESCAVNRRIEISALRKDGTEIPVELSVTPIHYGGSVTFSAFLREITERKLAEKQILSSKEEAESANKRLQSSLETAERLTVEAQAANKAKSEFLATMSHEIRTPMNGVLGFSGLMLDTNLTEEQREFTTTIKSSADALLAIINDILDFSKVEAGQLQLETTTFDLPSVALEVTRLLSAQARTKNLKIEFATDSAGLSSVLADASRVRQVLLNLAGNSLKFTHEGGVIIRLTPEPGVATNGAGDPEHQFVRVSIQDTGIGIPREKQAQLFQKFMQADSSHSRRYGGTGLGLAISKQLVELMGGRIGCDSETGRGSTFWFTLPCAKASPARADKPLTCIGSARSKTPSPDANQASATLFHGLRVLVAEDNKTNQLLALTLLHKLGCQADLAKDGREAFDKAREQTYALILMDCHMPELNGFEATAEIRRWEKTVRASRPGGAAARLPIIALTASLMEEDKRQCTEAGMDDFLGKPIQISELVRALKQWGVRNTDTAKAP